MDNRFLGRTGMSVSPLCLGTMMFGKWGNDDHEDSVRVIHAALDAGINFVDTADVYSRGESEEIVGKALAGGRRDGVILATKVHGKMDDDDPNQMGNSRRWITRAVEESLHRLGTDWIDLYQIHRPDPHIDIAETLGALTDLQRAGKIRAFGCSTFPAESIVESQWASERHSLGAVHQRAAALLDLHARDREGRPPDRTALRHGRASLEPAGGRVARRQVPAWGGGHSRQQHPSDHDARPLRRLQGGERGQARRGRGLGRAGGRGRHHADPPRPRLHPGAPRDHGADHRPADDGAAREPDSGRPT